MFELKVKTHGDALKNDLNEIIRVKSIAWPYPYAKQLKWLNDNLSGADLHLLLQKENETFAYLNLINIDMKINDETLKAFGVGNVCSVEKGMGFGNELMKLTNQFIKESKKPGLLFCKPELVSFYEKFSWMVIEKKRLCLNANNQNIETMFFNIYQKVQLLTYYGNLF